MNNRSSNPIGSFVSLIVFLGIVGYILAQANIVSAASMFIWIIVFFFLMLLVGGLRIVDQFDRGIVLTLGKYTSTRQPGLIWLFIGIQNND